MKKRLTIVSLTSGRLSGVDVFAGHLVRGLNERGYPARLLLTETDRSWLDRMSPPNDMPIDTLTYGPGKGLRSRLQAVQTYLESNAPCIYLPNYDYRHSPVSAVLSDRVPVIGIVHSDDPIHYQHACRLGKYWNGIVAVSRFIESKVRRLLPECQDRLAYIPYGIPPAVVSGTRDNQDDQQLRILYAGRLVQEQKRFKDVITIAKQLLQRQIPFHLTICGGAKDGPHLLRPLRGLIQAGIVEYLGIVPHDRLQMEYGRHDVYLLPSSYEGLPLGVMEAMAAGCIPVTTNLRSGIPELITDESNGFLLEVGDTRGFVDRLAELQIFADKRREMNKNVLSSFQDLEFTIDRMVSGYIQLIHSVWSDVDSGVYRRPPGRLPRSPWTDFLPESIRKLARSMRSGSYLAPQNSKCTTHDTSRRLA